jgi:catechol 2,3-dioxygenase-like lactoylglutathione lyase family enzyme
MDTTTRPDGGPLAHARAVTKLPARDLGRARAFYRDVLGLEAVEEREGGLRYLCGTTEFHLFASAGAASGTATQIGFEVEDLEGHRRARGVLPRQRGQPPRPRAGDGLRR